jgi:hypothetical protein
MTGFILSSSNISSFIPWSNKLYPDVRLMNFVSDIFSHLTSLCINFHFPHSNKSDGISTTARNFNHDCLCTNSGVRIFFTNISTTIITIKQK